MHKTGLALSATDQTVVTLRDVDFQTAVKSLEGCSVVAVCVKSQDTEEAASAIKRYAPDAHVIAFQNGISNLDLYQRVLPDAMISGAVVPFNVTQPDVSDSAPLLFHRGTDGALMISGSVPSFVTKALLSAGEAVETVSDIRGYLWAKLLVNLNNALNALSGGPLRDGLLQRDYRRVLIAMIREGLTVANAEGVEVATFNGRHPETLIKLMSKPDWIYRIIMDRIAKIDRTARSSMLDDLDQGRTSELDFLQGEIISRAGKQGLHVPVNRAVYDAAQSAFSKKTSPRMSGAEMRAAFL